MKADASPPEAALLELQIPDWVPEPVAQAARYAAVTPNTHKYLRRLICDERMKRVWHELARRRRDGTFMHAAARAPAWRPSGEDSLEPCAPDEQQGAAMANLLKESLVCVIDRGTTVTRQQAEQDHRRFLKLAQQLRADASLQWMDADRRWSRWIDRDSRLLVSAAGAYTRAATPKNWKVAVRTSQSCASEPAVTPRTNGLRSTSQLSVDGSLIRRCMVSPRLLCRSSLTARSRSALCASGVPHPAGKVVKRDLIRRITNFRRSQIYPAPLIMLPIGATVSNDVNEFRGEFFSEQEAADAADKSVRTLRAWRQRGEGPPYVLFGRTVKYRKDAFMEHFRASEIVPPRMRALIGSTTRQPKQFNSRSLVVKTPARIAVQRQRRGD
jgi:hypothetical protein